MRRRRGHKPGEATLETAVLLVIVAASLAVFFSFIRAAVSGRVKLGADAFGHGLLYGGRTSTGPGDGCIPDCRVTCGLLNPKPPQVGLWTLCSAGQSCPGDRDFLPDGCGGTCCCCCTKAGSCL